MVVMHTLAVDYEYTVKIINKALGDQGGVMVWNDSYHDNVFVQQC